VANLDNLIRQFQRTYGKSPRIFSAPGRVNLIGEHTDYNDGFVLPIAIDRRTYVGAAANDSRVVRVQSLDLNEASDFSLDEPDGVCEPAWLSYIAGIAFELETRGFKLSGADLLIGSEVPIGAGLSSSAALEISVAAAFLGLCNESLDVKDLALIAQKAEHTYVGTRCGIMDQLTVSAAQKSHALLIDCRSLDVKLIDLNLPDTTVVVCNTNVKHELASSAYNQRRRECEEAVSILRRFLPTISALRDVSVGDLEKHAGELPDVLYRRAHHVISENARTLEAAVALTDGDVEKFGKLMSASHASLRDDYEVSSAELDLMVELAGSCAGVFGARMTGGGFGGCTVNLVRTNEVESFSSFIAGEYRARTGIAANTYAVSTDDGVKEMKNGADENAPLDQTS
jgi:galactokinase